MWKGRQNRKDGIEKREKNFSQSKTIGSQEDKPPTENDLTW